MRIPQDKSTCNGGKSTYLCCGSELRLQELTSIRVCNLTIPNTVKKKAPIKASNKTHCHMNKALFLNNFFSKQLASVMFKCLKL